MRNRNKGRRRIRKPVGFDARLIGALGIGRYISGLLPPLSTILQDRLVVIARPMDVALVRGLTGGRVSVLASNARPYRLAEQTSLLLQLARARLTLVHFPHYSLPLLYRPFVATIHDLFPYRFPEIHSGPVPRAVNRLLIRNAVRRAAAVITPSDATAGDLAAQFPWAQRKITAIAEATNDRFTAARNQSAEASWQRYFTIRSPYFLYLGQWKAYKNVPLLIEAFAQLLTRRPDCQLVIAGEDPRHPEIPAAVSRLPAGSVVLPGRLPDDAIPDLYRSATALVLPSRAEGFGLPVLEAMACGVTVVCSDIPALRELANGVAIFCDPASAASFTAGMLTALESTTADGRLQRGIARAGQFSWSRAAEETVAVYERVLSG